MVTTLAPIEGPRIYHTHTWTLWMFLQAQVSGAVRVDLLHFRFALETSGLAVASGSKYLKEVGSSG